MKFANARRRRSPHCNFQSLGRVSVAQRAVLSTSISLRGCCCAIVCSERESTVSIKDGVLVEGWYNYSSKSHFGGGKRKSLAPAPQIFILSLHGGAPLSPKCNLDRYTTMWGNLLSPRRALRLEMVGDGDAFGERRRKSHRFELHLFLAAPGVRQR